MVKGILDGEGNAEKERQPGCIGKALYTQELFPINGRTVRVLWLWRGFGLDGWKRRQYWRGNSGLGLP